MFVHIDIEKISMGLKFNILEKSNLKINIDSNYTIYLIDHNRIGHPLCQGDMIYEANPGSLFYLFLDSNNFLWVNWPNIFSNWSLTDSFIFECEHYLYMQH